MSSPPLPFPFSPISVGKSFKTIPKCPIIISHMVAKHWHRCEQGSNTLDFWHFILVAKYLYILWRYPVLQFREFYLGKFSIKGGVFGNWYTLKDSEFYSWFVFHEFVNWLDYQLRSLQNSCIFPNRFGHILVHVVVHFVFKSKNLII